MPAQPTALIGRDAEVVGACQRFMRPDVRLLTLVGPGGVGKTRLVIAVGERLGTVFRNRSLFVDLAPVKRPELVIPTIAEALGLRETSGASALEQLLHRLADQQLLLILDNFEQVIDAAPELSMLLANSRELKVLVTSREALRLSWEHQYLVRPLGVPRAGETLAPEALERIPSVALFVERAQAADSDFALNINNAAAVAAICLKLEGLPLAITLAAAHVPRMRPDTLLAHLGHRLEFLADGARDDPARHQALRSALAWSYDLLDEREQRLFRRLGVFVGGTTLAAIEMVCTGAGPLGLSMAEGVDSLVAKNLLRPDDTTQGEQRFAMMETVREFALECLEACGEWEATARSHAAYFLSLAESVRPELTAFIGPSELAWLERLELEQDNLRAILQWALRHDPQLGIRLAGAMWTFWHVRSRFSEGRIWLAQFLAMPAPELPTAKRATALRGLGYLALRQNDCPAAESAFQENYVLLTTVGDDFAIARAMHGQGLAAMRRGDYPTAHTRLEQSLAALRALGEQGWEALVLANLGEVALGATQHAQAAAYFRESLTLRQRLGDRWGIPQLLTYLGDIARFQGELKSSRDLYAEGLLGYQEIGSKHGVADCFEGLACLAAMRGQLERVAYLGGAAEALRETMGVPIPVMRQVSFQHALDSARVALSDEAFRASWWAGRNATLEQSIALAVAEGVESPASRRPGSTRSEPLTPRETEVIALVARGLSNRQIGEALVISQETAAVHVKHVLAKLGFSSRAQIAAWAAGQSLTADAPQLTRNTRP